MESKVFAFLLVAACVIALSTATSYKKGGHKVPRLGWSDWKPWSSCSKTCGGGVQTRKRVCKFAVKHVYRHLCKGSSTQTRPCNTQDCPVDGMWSEWSDGACSVTCEQGTLVRTRQCNNPSPSNGGKDCVGPSSETAVCDTGVNCPVDGMWSDWTDGPCSVTCDEGTLVRTRQCNNPAPSDGGADCVGPSSETATCDTGVDCPVDGMWSEWTDGPCSVTCDEGQLTRTRECNNPPPSNGGADCAGPASETATCDTGVNCPIDGEWSDWDDWSSCSKTCKGGIQTRTRECDDPAPQFGGEDCDGPDSETRSCPGLRYIPCIDITYPKHPDYQRNVPGIDESPEFDAE